MSASSSRSVPSLLVFYAAVLTTFTEAAAPKRFAVSSSFLGADKDQALPLPQSSAPVLRDYLQTPDGTSTLHGQPWIVEAGFEPMGSSKHSPLWKVVGRSRKPSVKRAQRKFDIEAFFSSTVAGQWVVFGLFWLLLLRLSLFIQKLQLESSLSHVIALGLWVMAAMGFLTWTFASSGSHSAGKWLDGYVMELVLSMENIFLYHMILVSFKVPARMARHALFVVSICQMLFQMFMFMGIAAFIQEMHVLPYLLGAWLILVGLQTMRDDDHEGFDAAHSESYKTFRLAMGDRLLPHYELDGSVFVYKNSRLSMTMMGPVTFCLLLVMFAMEVDVTLTKIEEIDSHFIAWSSSVLAAFALPELFVVVRKLLRHFYLLKIGISFLVIFFGILLLFRDDFQLSDSAELAVMFSIVFGSIVLSPVLGYQQRDATMYTEQDDGSAAIAKQDFPSDLDQEEMAPETLDAGADVGSETSTDLSLSCQDLSGHTIDSPK